MSVDNEINFVNRKEELDALLSRIYPRSTKNTITILRSPSGYGKSSLTDRLIEAVGSDGPTCIVVDPSIRSKSRSDRVYAWFFVQRAAEPGALRKNNGRAKIRTFSQFVRLARYSKINWKHIYENLKEIASLSKVNRFVIELFENLSKTGRYNPDAILQDDSLYSTKLAQDYVSGLACSEPALFIIRECQNIDPESLRFFLALGEKNRNLAVILEYTTPAGGRFSPDHEKIILDTVSDESSLMIFDLMRLNMEEFRTLLRKYVDADKKIETAAELTWDGNLRIIKELKYRLMIGSSVDAASPLLLPATIKQNLELLPKRKKTILAIIASHVEAIQFDTLLGVMRRIESKLTAKKLNSELEHLANEEKYVRIGKLVSLADEDLMDAVATSDRMKPLVLLAENRLREFYLDVIKGATFTGVPLSIALRQAIVLCARTGDVVALQNLVETLDASIVLAVDQTLYINIVAGAVLSREDLSYNERQGLVDWTVAAAYEVGDYPTAASLLETNPNLSVYEKALLACCYGEANRHAEALKIARQIKSGTGKTDRDALIIARLIECASLFALGSKRESLDTHAALRRDAELSASPLFGFVLRYTEIVKDFPHCTSDVLKSAELLRSQNLLKSAAYSQLVGAIHLAFAGEVGEASRLIRQAETALLLQVRDRQIIFNNAVVVELLSDEPDLDGCLEKLSAALFTVRDDFSRLTLHNNRLICFWLHKDYIQASHCATIIESILRAPDFGNRDVFRTVCFNVCGFFDEFGEPENSERFKSLLSSLSLKDSCYENYWKVRFGLAESAEPEFDFLLKFKYHPAYLSHWVIDLEGLMRLKAKRGQ